MNFCTLLQSQCAATRSDPKATSTNGSEKSGLGGAKYTLLDATSFFLNRYLGLEFR